MQSTLCSRYCCNGPLQQRKEQAESDLKWAGVQQQASFSPVIVWQQFLPGGNIPMLCSQLKITLKVLQKGCLLTELNTFPNDFCRGEYLPLG